MENNPSDYSLTGKLFFNYAPSSLYHFGADICYLTDIKHKNQNYKIGIVSKNNLIDDLKTRNSI
jgi:hypothetical protein